MQFNQTNNNKGNVNNAIASKGNVVQTVGEGNNIEIEQPAEESIWSTLTEKVKAGWKLIFG